MENCPLCKLATGDIVTRLYYQDMLVVVVDCLTCGVGYPLIVLKRHTMKPTDIEVVHMKTVAKELFGENVVIRKTQRQIPDHLHWHISENNPTV